MNWWRVNVTLQFQVQEPAERVRKTRVVVKKAEEFVLVNGILEFLDVGVLGVTCVSAFDVGDVFYVTFPDNANRVCEAQTKAIPLKLVCEADDTIVSWAGWLRNDNKWWVSDSLGGHALKAR